jgi:uncharacterized protein involved in exopolysaccharide biosynthesis
MATRDTRNEAGLSLGDLYGVMRRRRGWFVIPTAIGVVASLVLALTLPAEYEASATVTVEPPVIPDKLAPNTIASDTETRYENLKLQLLARDSLSSIITDFKLFEGATSAREVQVEDLRQRISIAPLPPAIVDPRKPVELNSFRVSFRYSDPKITAAVSNRLARDFISANLRDSTSLADGTMEFFDQQLQKARAGLPTSRARSRTTRRTSGRAPEQLLLNRDRLSATHRSASTRRLGAARSGPLGQSIQEMRSPARPIRATRACASAARSSSTRLSLGKTEKHPDVVRMRRDGQLDDRGREDAGRRVGERPRCGDKLRDYEVDGRCSRARWSG